MRGDNNPSDIAQWRSGLNIFESGQKSISELRRESILSEYFLLLTSIVLLQFDAQNAAIRL